MKILLTILFSLIVSQFTWAQNTPVSQYYAAPMLLNPGLTGTTDEFRAAVLYRGQVAQGGFGNLSNIFGFDYNFENNGLAIGLMIDQLVQTGANQRTTFLSGLVAYQIDINERWKARPGIKFSYGRRDINFSNSNYFIPYTPSQSPNADNITFLSADAGFIIHEESFWFGATLYNLNQPDVSIFADINDQLNTTLNIHTGYRYSLSDVGKDDEAITLAINYINNTTQSSTLSFNLPNDQLDLGLYYTTGFTQLGAWYRGLNTKANNAPLGYVNPHNMVVMAAINVNGLNLGYSYEFRVRGTGFANFHELSLAYNFNNSNTIDDQAINGKGPMPWL